MQFMDAIKHVFSNYATFSGRARRSEYWNFTLFNVIVSGVLSVLAEAGSLFAIISGVYSLAVLVPSLAVVWRRLHDVGKSGAWYFIALVPLVGWILLLYWMCKDSQPGTNEYGPSPKYPDAGSAGAGYADAGYTKTASAAPTRDPWDVPKATSAKSGEDDEFDKMLKAFKDSKK